MGRVAVEDWPALEALVARVERGEAVEITRGGETVARVEAGASGGPEAVAAQIARMRALRRGVRLGDLDVRAAIDEGRE